MYIMTDEYILGFCDMVDCFNWQVRYARSQHRRHRQQWRQGHVTFGLLAVTALGVALGVWAK